MRLEIDDVLREATRLCQDEKEQDAEILVTAALIDHPNNLDLLTKLGFIQTRLCKDEDAESTFQSVIAGNPDHEEAICGFGRLLDQSLRVDEAESLYRDYLERNPSSHCVIDDLCRLLISEERENEALEIARKHIQQFPSEINAYDALRYSLVMTEERLSEELDNKESVNATLNILTNLVEQLTVINRIRQELDTTSLPERELLDEKSRIAGEIEYVFSSAQTRGISIPEEIVTSVDMLLKL
ncbi:MAG: hypothetical protein ACFFEE_03080 [Candidatus Thorarchaeota archaeon]